MENDENSDYRFNGNPVSDKNGKRTLYMSALLFLAFLGLSRAQTEQGTFMLGSDIGSGIITSSSNGLLGINFGLNDGAGIDLGLSPKVGWFVRDNFLIGAIVNLGYSKSPESNLQQTDSFVYGLQALTRYYIVPRDVNVDDVPRRLRFFGEINGGLSGINIKDGATTNGFAYGTGPGLAYFITDNVSLETSLKYNGLLGAGNTAYQHALSLNLGIQIFLTRDRAENILESEQRAVN